MAVIRFFVITLKKPPFLARRKGDGRSHEQMLRIVARATAATPHLDAGYFA
jgi:hypothetical protein